MIAINVTPACLARWFSTILREWIEPHDMKEVIRRNKTPDYASGSCASHDLCDANQAMLNALETVGLEWHGADDPLDPLIAAAWSIARRAEFNPELITETAEYPYDALVKTVGGRVNRGTFRDWFSNDTEAIDGFKQILKDQGYSVARVDIGFPCVVTLE